MMGVAIDQMSKAPRSKAARTLFTLGTYCLGLSFATTVADKMWGNCAWLSFLSELEIRVKNKT